jgi:transglutaminase-like putative cysteine protease
MTGLGKKTAFWLVACFSVAMAPQLLKMPLLLAALTLTPVLWRVTAELKNWKPVSSFTKYALTAVGLVSLFVSYGGLAGRRAAVSLLTLMLALKLLECYRIRDARLLVCFTLFLATTQFLFTQNILMPVYGFVVIMFALGTLAQLQRNEAWFTEGSPPVVRASLLSELGFGLRILALAVPVGLAFFIFFPRLASPLWGIPESTLDAKSGLSGSMSPGSIQQLFMDDSPAFRVEFDGPAPSADELYWRGPVFWRFDGKSWNSSFYGRNVLNEQRPDPGGRSWSYSVQLEPNERKWLFALDYPEAAPPNARQTLDFQLLHQKPLVQLLKYSITSYPDLLDAPELGDPLRSEALEVPEDSSPLTREFIGGLRLQAPSDAAFIRRVLEHFNQQPFFYSLNSPLLGNQPVDEFLFDTRTGYCEHYASSFAIMMRLGGIPSRIVTGYQGGWFNAMGNYFLVRQSDAHAWVEVWLADSGWTRIDPTAAVSPTRIEQGSLGALDAPRHLLDYSWLRNLRNSVDIVQQRWNDWVIEYGAARQRQVLSPFGLDRMTPSMLIITLFATLGVLGAILFPLVLRIRGPGYRDPLQQTWKRFLHRLRKAGFESRASDGPLEIGEAAAKRLPKDSGAIMRITNLYCRSRYSVSPPPLLEIKQAVSKFHPTRKTG